uniref:Protein kinase domain-containing protein n=1 Tax=Cyprinus carpio TaxID=7962 RepID=A0A8C2C9U1_CYPCA
MSADSEMERKICDLLRRDGKSKALIISNKLGLDKRTVQNHLYSLERSNQVFKTDEQPRVWDLIENKSEIKLKPEQKSQKTRDTSVEKDVEDLLMRSGSLKACQIATDLGQFKQSINKQLYSMEEKGKVRRDSKSNLWTLNEEWSDDSFSQESDHGLESISGLQNFKVITMLGEGGFGCVYKVKHIYDRKIYAVKRVILTRKADSEVKALARLDHPNIVRYITCWPSSDDWTSNQERNQVSNTSSDVVTFDREGCEERDDDDEDDEDEDDVTSGMESLSVTESASAAAEASGNNRTDSRTYLFIQMEFCEGGTLTELIYRDLKPDNILFGADGKVKIGDFGLVAAQTDQNGDPIERSNRGTPTYMSPEQKNKKNYDEKTDIFPLGLVWFEMLWKISTGSERVKLWPDLRDHRFPEGFSDSYQTESKFITKMLSDSPEHRPHAKDIKEKLEKFFSLDQNLLSQKTI